MHGTRPTTVTYIKILHKEDALTGLNGRSVNEFNPPAYEAGDIAEIRKVSEYYCCTDMAHHFRAGHIAFGQRTEEAHQNRVAEVFIRVENGAQVIPTEGYAPKEGGSPALGERRPKLNTDIPIPYCPWCRQPVLTEEIATIL